MIRSRWISSSGLAGLLCISGCQSPDSRPSGDVSIFTPGEEGDPVVAMAKQAATAGTQTTQVNIQNGTGWSFTAGLITKAPLFTVGTTGSAALTAFVTGANAKAGDATALATALGLTLGVDAWVTTAASSAGGTGSAWVEATPSQTLYYLARVSGSTDDFVASSSFTLNSTSVALTGYDLNDNGGRITQGNGTTGSSIGTLQLKNITACLSGAVMTVSQKLLSEAFTAGANDPLWPKNIGWAGDFNGDWYTDGVSVRVRVPGQPGTEAAAPSPTVTGFVKFIDVCPTTNATLSVTARTDTTKYTSQSSDTTLVVYFFDAANNLLKVSANYPLYRGNDRTQALYDVSVPIATRRIAVAPMAYLSAGETQPVFLQNLDVDYVVSTSTTTSLGTDAFTSYSNGTYGRSQPTGWQEFGGDWFAHTTLKVATLWNPKWGGDQSRPPPVDTGMVKTFTISSGNNNAADKLDVKLFAAATFTDPTSFVRLRAIFANGTTVESERLQGTAYSDLWIRRAQIPSVSSNVRIIVNAYLGPLETSSLYVDDLIINRIR